MAFMKPHYTREAFHVGDNTHGERTAVPADVYGTLDRFAEECDLVRETCEIVEGKVWARLSAPGYMDCTEWDGPYRTLEEARRAIADMWDVDPDTGDDLDDDGDVS